jgi:solute:Na+ symporter, SSS family
MYTDAFQGGIMMFGMAAILILTYYYLGGVTEANQALTNMANLVPKSLASQGMTGWTTFPNLGSPLWLTMVTTIIMGVGIGVLAQPQLVVRFLTAKDDKALNRAVPIGGIFILLMTGVAFTVGALTNVYFYQHYGLISWSPAGVSGAMSSNTDNIIPLYINDAMPPVIVVLFMLTLLAAAMSTLSSIFHTMGSAAGHDIWLNLQRSRLMKRKEVKDEHPYSTKRPSQIGTLIMIMASVALAYVMPGSIIARATAMFMGLCAAAFLPMYTYALFSKKPYRLAAVLSLSVGAIVWFVWTAFFHAAEAKPLGICQALFGKPYLLGLPWSNVDPMVIALPCSIAALAIGWYIDSRKDPDRKTTVSV